MVVIVTELCQRGRGCDTVMIRDYDGREVYFKRALLPHLIKKLAEQTRLKVGAGV